MIQGSMDRFRRFLINLSLPIISIVIFLGAAEAAVRIWTPTKVLTYYDEQTKLVLGYPAAKKEAGEYRIFIFGGSSAYGFPISDRYSIAAWMRKSFRHLLPEKKIQVINCGWPGKASHHVAQGVLNVMKYQPDLFIIYDGHNDPTTDNRLFLDNRLYALNLRLKFQSAFYQFLSNRLNRLRKHFVYGSSGYAEKHYREEVIAKKVYQRAEVTEEEYERIAAGFRKNLESVMTATRRRGVKVLTVNLPSNLRDIPPAVSLHSDGLSKEELERWNRHYEEGKRFEEAGQYREAATAYEEAAKLDPDFAELHYRLGICYEKLALYEKAKNAFTLARDRDLRPWRAKSRLNEIIREVSEAQSAIFVDLVKAFEEISPHGIIDRDLIHDDVHPSYEGQQLIAEVVLQALFERGEIAPKESWQWDALEEAREGVEREDWKAPESLNAYRFILRGLHLWQQGRYGEVVPDLKRGLSLMPDFIESYGFLADAYWHLGEPAKAQKAFQDFRQKDATLFETLLKRYPELYASYTGSLKGKGL